MDLAASQSRQPDLLEPASFAASASAPRACSARSSASSRPSPAAPATARRMWR